MKKIILSGGWSYGNLGDEAILMTSIKLLHQQFPEHKIIVLLYRNNDTEKYLKSMSYVTVRQSLHSKMFGVEEKRMEFGGGFWEEIKLPMRRRFNNLLLPIREDKVMKNFLKSPSNYFKYYEEAYNYFSELCANAEMYVMSGGGYINDWEEMLISKYFETIIAKECHLKTYMVGQTVGPFRNPAMQIFKLMLKNIDFCFFRDVESIKDTRLLGYDCLSYIVPDLALGEETIYKKEDYVVLVPFLTDLNAHMEDIIKNMKAIVAESGYKVVVTVSQQWAWCIQVATSFYIALKNQEIDVKFVVPQDYKELEWILSSAQFVFSQNLHGLILAYRGHTPVVCLNGRRKFVSFMKMIGKEENLIIPNHITDVNLLECFKRRGEFDFNNCRMFQKQIKEALEQTIK